jgi:GT2 family glycosyltransferase
LQIKLYFLDLSIIIVNYNVKYFLEHCLVAAEKASANLETEIFVLDNDSTDGSKQYFENRFTFVRFIYNRENSGFAKGNNIALKQATGRYVLFLNPDTIVPEDAFTKCIRFFDAHPDAGALGVKMIDGAGNFLKESKRSFPSPITSFYKLSGLSRLFPKSAIFSKYHLGNLDENKNQVVDVLAGAFMMVKKTVLDKTGSFDESFFMYGEDVDLSYRIQQAGYKNYYLYDPAIIHFKGESTKRGSLNYVRMFYRAMSQFVTKQYGLNRAKTFNIFIQLAIFVRAGLSGIRRFIRWIGLPLIDAGIIMLCIWGVKLYWYAQIKTGTKYNREILVTAAFIYMATYLLISYLSGLYDKQFKQKNLNRSAIVSSLVLVALYGLLPEQFRFSRGIILFSAIAIYLALSILRFILTRTNLLDAATDEDEEKQTLVISNPGDFLMIRNLFEKANLGQRILGYLDTSNEGNGLANYHDFQKFAGSIEFKNIVFSTNSLQNKVIIDQLQTEPDKYKVKFYSKDAFSIIGSDSKNTIGESITHHGKFNIDQPDAIRCKRLVDLFVSSGLLLFSPFIFWWTKSRKNYFLNLWLVFTGSRTFIGYNSIPSEVPKIKAAIFPNNNQPLLTDKLSEEVLKQLDYRYAKNYTCKMDLVMVFKNYFR